MDAVDKVLERLPYSDGAWRRRFISGLIFFSVVSVYGILANDKSCILVGALAGIEIKDLLQSTQLLLVAALLVFAMGSIIDAMTVGFIIRGGSVILKILNDIFDLVPRETWPRRVWVPFTILLSFLTWPLAILVGTIATSAGFDKLYTIGLCRNNGKFLTPEATNFFNNLPTPIRKGLDEPFGDKFDPAWQGLVEMAPPLQKHWVNRQGSKNYDLAAFLSSALVGTVSSVGVYFSCVGWSVGTFAWSYVTMCILSYLLFGCLSIFSVLELLTICIVRKS